MQKKLSLYLVSACLMGLHTRYDGKIKKDSTCMQRLQNGIWLPICPEQLGGLPTPRKPAHLEGGNGHDVLAGRARVITTSGEDVTQQFILGAHQVLKIATSQCISGIYLKSRSPSCGVSVSCGVTAALLLQHGFTVEDF